MRILALLFLCGTLAAQMPTSSTTTEYNQAGASPAVQDPQAPKEEPPAMGTLRVEVVERTTRAVNYRHRGGATAINFEGTQLLPGANGEAKVESKQGYMEIEVEFDDMKQATAYGPEYLTYVLWAITPEGRARNLGEVLLNGNRGKLNVTTDLQSFGMVVTAEPHFAVTYPSDVVVMENIIRPDTKGAVEVITAKYQAFERGHYKPPVHITAQPLNITDKSTPLELYEARNALRIAEWADAPTYARDVYNRAKELLARAEGYQARKIRKSVVMMSREAAQTAESAHLLAVRNKEQERLAKERQAAAEREAQARATAEDEARRRAEAEAQARRSAEQQQRAETQQQIAERQAMESQLAAERSARESAEAEAARIAAMRDQETARAEADAARSAAQKAEAERQQALEEQRALRERLRQQLNAVLETRETARGLIVNMSDVLFETGKASLRTAAQLKLARIAGILVAHHGLNLQIEGHTDSVGSDEYNQRLSERRGESVRAFLQTQGVTPDSMVVTGLGESAPVAPNTNAAGRKQNRRVEIVVSGEAIGGEQAGTATQPATVPPPETPR